MRKAGLFALFPCILLASAATAASRWTPQQAQAWSQKIGWTLGCNFIPSSAVNQLEMWQADSFDPATIDRELGWAHEIGLRSARVFLHHLAWKQDPKGFLDRMDQFLAIADKHKIGILFVFFDSCWDPSPRPGKQRAPRPHVHNSGWVQDPGREILCQPDRLDELEPYVAAVLGRFGTDPRVHAWDLFNEPDNDNGSSYGADGLKTELPDKSQRILPLLEKVFHWARKQRLSQPVTAGVWIGDWQDPAKASPTVKICLDQSDVISFHNYGPPEEMARSIQSLRRYGRPILCTEFMSRGSGSTFERILPVLRQANVSGYCWGLVAGKTQTNYPWDSWQKQYKAEPTLWFHDIFRKDGTPYDRSETERIRRITSPRPNTASSSRDRSLLDSPPACPDPAILQSPTDHKFYVFGTGRGIPVWQSDDLLVWRRAGRVFTEDVPSWAQDLVPKARIVWAPDISWFNGLYHLYYSVSSLGSQRSAIGLAVCTQLGSAGPDGHWKDLGPVLQSAPGPCDFNAIDPALCVDRDGTPYLFWGSFWTGIKACRVDPATGKLAENPPKIVSVASRAKGVDPPAIEASFVIFRDGFYYLFVSWDACCSGLQSNYKVMVGRASSVLGPYVDFQGRPLTDGGGTLVLASTTRWRAPGHNSILRTDRGDWLVCHAYDAEDPANGAQEAGSGRLLHIRPLLWLNGWPSVGQPLCKPIGETRMPGLPQSAAGIWCQGVDFGPSHPIDLRPDGAIHCDGQALGTWQQSGDKLTLRWPDPKAPAGAWLDHVVLELDGTAYTGRNQRGHVITATRR